jgi:hypothetical protein
VTFRVTKVLFVDDDAKQKKAKIREDSGCLGFWVTNTSPPMPEFLVMDVDAVGRSRCSLLFLVYNDRSQ